MKNESDIKRAFVKHPPRHPFDPGKEKLVTSEEDIANNTNIPEWIAVATRERSYLKSKNPVEAIESIILSHKSGIYPHLSILDWLAESLQKWHKESGRITMEQAMGLHSKGRTGNVLKEATKQQWEQDLMVEFFRLRCVFSITNPEAAQMIATRLEDTDWNLSEYKIPAISEETIIDKWKRKWAKIFNEIPNGRDIHKNTSDEEKREILTHYPKHAYEHLKQMEKYL